MILRRVRLSWKEEHLIFSISVHLLELSVGEFLAYITTIFQERKKLDKDNKFLSASLSGFKLDNNDLIQNVLMNDDIIELTDYKSWVSEIFKKNSYNEWHKLSEYDFEDDCRKWISVGTFFNNSQLCISLGTGSTTEKLDLFELEELQNFSKNGRTLVCQKGDTSSSSQIFFEVENNIVKEIILSLKTKSDFRPQIFSIKINVNDGLEMIEGSLIQTALELPERFDDHVPSPVYKGEDLKDPEVKEQPITNGEFVDAKGVVMKQNDEAFLCIDCGRNRQQISIEFLLMNNNSIKTSIINIIGEYKKDNEWIPATLFSGSKSSPYHYSLSYANDHIITLESRMVMPLAISLLIPIELKHTPLSYQLRFLHKSFEDPLQLRYTITTQDGDKFTLYTQVSSKTYDFITYEKCLENRKGLVKFLYCDDLEIRERLHASFSVDSDNHLSLSLSSYTHTISLSKLKEIIYNAVKSNAPVYYIEDYFWSNGEYSAKFYALVNLEKKYVYAFKCILQTSTNYTEEYLPLDPKYYI